MKMIEISELASYIIYFVSKAEKRHYEIEKLRSDYPICWNSGCPENCIYHHRVSDCPYHRAERESYEAYKKHQRQRRLTAS